MKFHLCLNLNGILNYLWNSFIQLITIAMNLFDQLVNTYCDPVMEK